MYFCLLPYFVFSCMSQSFSQGNDWILPSSTLTLKKVSEADEGTYTCMAEHPSMASLNKKRTISITVLSGKKRNT